MLALASIALVDAFGFLACRPGTVAPTSQRCTLQLIAGELSREYSAGVPVQFAPFVGHIAEYAQ